MDHTPQATADDRALRLLERATVPDPHRDLLLGLVKDAQAAAEGAGAELQAEFGREHVGLIVGCNQFLRLYRSGVHAGAVEVFLDPSDRKRLEQAGFTLQAPELAVFKLFGWVRIDPTQGDATVLHALVPAALAKAAAAKKPN